jgi:hypothetical protein
MTHSISDKLKIKTGFCLLTINAPADFKKGLQGLPPGVSIGDAAKTHNQMHWFVKCSAQSGQEMSPLIKLVKPGVTVWVYYPKVSSKIQINLTRDRGRDCQLAESDKLKWINLISFDETWSLFGFRAKTDKQSLLHQGKFAIG